MGNSSALGRALEKLIVVSAAGGAATSLVNPGAKRDSQSKAEPPVAKGTLANNSGGAATKLPRPTCVRMRPSLSNSS